METKHLSLSFEELKNLADVAGYRLVKKPKPKPPVEKKLRSMKLDRGGVPGRELSDEVIRERVKAICGCSRDIVHEDDSRLKEPD